MEPLTAALAVKETLPVATLKEAGLQLSKSEVEKLAPVQIADTPFLQVHALVENVPLGEQQASFFSASEYRTLSVIERPGLQGIQIRLGEHEINLSLKSGDALDIIGVKNLISYSLTPSIDHFTHIRLQELKGDYSSARNRLEKSKIELPTKYAVAIRPSDAGAFLGELEKVSSIVQDLKRPLWFSAKRIDYLVGNQYVQGRVCDMPVVGGISNMIFKKHLALDIEGADWGKLGDDVFMVISIAALPLVPATGGLAMAGWISANATFGAVSQGAISYLTSQDPALALKSAGKGALLGSVGGIAGVLAVGKIMPAISSKLLASTAVGATSGSMTGAADATIRVIEKGEDLASAAKEVATATMVGAVGGGIMGAAFHSVSHVVSKMANELPKNIEAITSSRAEAFEKFLKQIEPIFPADRSLNMGDIRNYGKQLNSQLDGFAAYLKQTDPSFSRFIDKYRSLMSEALAASDPERIAKIERQMKKGLVGKMAEAQVKSIFEPFFDKVTTQKRVRGGVTIIDMVLEGAKRPIAIKGHRFIERGGSLPIEVKAGTENYFKNEIASGHLLKQVGGHTDFGKGMVVTTRDVKDALLDTGNAKQILKDAGSTVYRLLPYKADIDAAVARLVRGESV